MTGVTARSPLSMVGVRLPTVRIMPEAARFAPECDDDHGIPAGFRIILIESEVSRLGNLLEGVPNVCFS